MEIIQKDFISLRIMAGAELDNVIRKASIMALEEMTTVVFVFNGKKVEINPKHILAIHWDQWKNANPEED